MDAQQALADLTEISSQIEAAVVFDDKGKVVGSTLPDGDAFAKAASDLLAAAEELKTGDSGLTQLEIATADGSVFVGAAFIRRRAAQAERADLYFEDGSMLSLSNGSPGADRLLPLARQIIGQARTR